MITIESTVIKRNSRQDLVFAAVKCNNELVLIYNQFYITRSGRKGQVFGVCHLSIFMGCKCVSNS